MSTTKFMTATGSNRELHIKRSNEDHVQIRQFDPEFHTHQAKTFFLNPSEAPALALAILEAAGVEPDREPLECQVSLGTIVADLQATIKHGEALAAAARERAELEAEALMLANSAVLAVGNPPYPSIEHMSDTSLRKWLAVARKARELGGSAEK